MYVWKNVKNTNTYELQSREKKNRKIFKIEKKCKRNVSSRNIFFRTVWNVWFLNSEGHKIKNKNNPPFSTRQVDANQSALRASTVPPSSNLAVHFAASWVRK
jgi:hypothetical protein